MSQPFTPTLKWHLKVLAGLSALCILAFFVLSYAGKQLPAPYQKKTPAAETTPWLNK